MNLVNGKILQTEQCDAVLDTLNSRIVATLEKPRLEPETVVAACDRLVTNLNSSYYLNAMADFGIPEALAERYIAEARTMFGGTALRERLRTELGEDQSALRPLGVLLHIAAGNADGLPVFSVLEGLLTGNINILKLPAEEGCVSVRLLLELIREEPLLAEYIYVFDYSSRDVVNITKLVDAADAVVVWGGDEAVSALRRLVKPNTKLIEWGHKVSFGYVTLDALDDAELAGFARNIAETGQALCSSCQGIFVDTDDTAQLKAFAERFLPLLEAAFAERAHDVGVAAQLTLELYTAELEAPLTGFSVYRGANCGIIVAHAGAAESAIAPGIVWVKPLRRAELLRTLRPHKNHLQTVGLLCPREDYTELSESFYSAGAVRVTSGEAMSHSFVSPHDGEFPLRRYSKIVEIKVI